MFNYGSEELAHHRHRDLLDTATYIRNARRARERANRAGAHRDRRQAIARWFARLTRPARRQPTVVPVPPKPSPALRPHAAVDDDLLVAC
jgi:hypothetical protein